MFLKKSLYIACLLGFYPLLGMKPNALIVRQPGGEAVKPAALGKMPWHFEENVVPVVRLVKQPLLLDQPELRKHMAIVSLAASDEATHWAYAHHWFSTSAGQQTFLTVIRTQPALKVADRFNQSKKLADHSDKRTDALIEDARTKELIEQDRTRRKLDLEHGSRLSDKQEKFFIMNDDGRKLCEKLYTHFSDPAQKCIDLYTPEWKVVQGLPLDTKREFRTFDEFLRARRLPTANEQFGRVVGGIGQGVCVGLGIGSPVALVTQGVETALSVLPSRDECSTKIKDCLATSLYQTTHDAFKNADEKFIPFQSLEDATVTQAVDVVNEIVKNGPDNAKNDFIVMAQQELNDKKTQIQGGTFNLRDNLGSSQVGWSVGLGALAGFVSGMWNVSSPCEEKQINQIN